MKNIYHLILLILISSCNNAPNHHLIEKWKNEIISTELEFTQMAQSEGISKAFLNYAADEAVLLRNNCLIVGKDSIRASFKGMNTNHGSLVWKPDFVDVATSGDLGYTYGKYTYTTTDSLGNTNVSEGIFHTVWKRQEDGSWKFVWD